MRGGGGAMRGGGTMRSGGTVRGDAMKWLRCGVSSAAAYGRGDGGV